MHEFHALSLGREDDRVVADDVAPPDGVHADLVAGARAADSLPAEPQDRCRIPAQRRADAAGQFAGRAARRVLLAPVVRLDDLDVVAFAEGLRAEAAGSGVHIATVIPGVVDTGFFAARGRPYQRSRPKPIPADAVAEAVVRTVVEDRAETWIPGWLRIAPAVRALAPGAYRRLVVRFG